jgi:hypothetical protein
MKSIRLHIVLEVEQDFTIDEIGRAFSNKYRKGDILIGRLKGKKERMVQGKVVSYAWRKPPEQRKPINKERVDKALKYLKSKDGKV